MIVDVIMPKTTGVVVAALKAGYAASGAAYASTVTVGGKLPAERTARMVSVRDDSGPDDGVLTRRRYGVNVYAAQRTVAGKVVETDAEDLALLSMAIIRKLPGVGSVKATDAFYGPTEMFDDPPMTVGNANLNHFYFTFRLTAKGVDFTP